LDFPSNKVSSSLHSISLIELI